MPRCKAEAGACLQASGAMALLGLMVLASQVLGVQSQSATSSTALSEARNCMLNGGKLNLFRPLDGSRHWPRCLVNEGCPMGSTEIYSTCVNPIVNGAAMELALTLHAPCTDCVMDNGMELAGKLWLALCAALQVPLQETKASVLLMGQHLWDEYPLQHFSLQKAGEGPLVSNYGGTLVTTARDVGYSWDFFMAVRIHTSRVDPGDPALGDLLANFNRPLLEILGQTDGVNVFESRSRATLQVTGLDYLSAVYKVHGLRWGEDPPIQLPHESASPPSPPPSPPPPPPITTPTTSTSTTRTTEAATATTIETTSAGVRCQCHSSWLGDGMCDHYCNTEECGWDAGDCWEYNFGTTSEEYSQASPGDDGTSSYQWPNGYYSASTSELPAYPGSDNPGANDHSTVISLSADNDDGALHVTASSDGLQWYIDKVDKDYAESTPVSPWFIVGIVVLVGCIVPTVCFLARNPKKKTRDAEDASSKYRATQYGWQDEERSGSKEAMRQSNYSTSTTDSGGHQNWPNSPAWTTYGSPVKDAKIHPEPDLEDPEEIRNSQGDWRKKKKSSKSPSAQQQGLRSSEAQFWQKAEQPQPPGSSNWYARQAEIKLQRQKEADDKRKEEAQREKAETEEWQQQWRQAYREKESEAQRQKEERKRRQKQEEAEEKSRREAEERQRRRQQQEEDWKRQEDELRKRQQQEQEAARRRQQDEQRNKEETAQREARQRQEQQQKKQQERAEKESRRKQGGGGFGGGLFGRWGRAAGRAASEPPPQDRRSSSAGNANGQGNNFTKFPGGSNPGASSTPAPSAEDKKRAANEEAERKEREKAAQAANQKADSLLNSVMKQLDDTKNSSQEERKKVFRELQRQLHPDKNLDNQEAANIAFQKLMERRGSYLA
mmetsp:Transcript_104190/g.185084  ORF Transcript_104190/g.185084 Transcript_104190/m.185084 type:complete len:890 (-) Transcript_104190:64-2733(-)